MTASNLYLVDSSGWIEFLGEGPRAGSFENYLRDNFSLVMPSIVFYEVNKKLLATGNQRALDRFVSHAMRSIQAPLDLELAAASARTSIEFKLAMADAVIYSTAQAFNAQLITADPDFRGLPGVTVL